MENITALLIAIASLVGAIYAVVQGILTARKADQEADQRRLLARAESDRIENEITDRVLERANSEMRKMNDKITELECENRNLSIRVATLQADYDTLKIQHNNLDREYKQVQRANQTQRTRIKDLENENRLLKERIEKLEKIGDTGPLKEH